MIRNRESVQAAFRLSHSLVQHILQFCRTHRTILKFCLTIFTTSGCGTSYAIVFPHDVLYDARVVCWGLLSESSSFSIACKRLPTDPLVGSRPVRFVSRTTSVFDTCNVHNDRAFGLEFHLDRLLRGAATARIEHTYTKEALRDVILQTIAAGGRKTGIDAFAKYWLSAGRWAKKRVET